MHLEMHLKMARRGRIRPAPRPPRWLRAMGAFTCVRGLVILRSVVILRAVRWMRQLVRPALLLATAACADCDRRAAGPPSSPPAPRTQPVALEGQPAAGSPVAPSTKKPASPQLAPTFIDADFWNAHQSLLQRGLTEDEKNALWARYYRQRWVQWTGQLALIKQDRLLFRHVRETLTFDVSLTIDRAKEPTLGGPLVVGRFYTYVGRLARFDGSFRLLYLDQGLVLTPDEFGVPGALIERPPISRQVPPPPHEVVR